MASSAQTKNKVLLFAGLFTQSPGAVTPGFFHLSFLQPSPVSTFSSMVEINIFQKSKKIDRTVQFPTEWNELSIAELQVISNSILTDLTTPDQSRALVLFALLKLRCDPKDTIKNFDQRFDAEDLVINGLPLLDFIYTANGLTRQPFPVITLLGNLFTLQLPQALQGREDDFENLTCGEFEDAEIFYHEFKKGPAAISLAKLASVLYRPLNMKYIEYNASKGTYITYDGDKLVRRFMKLSPWKLYTIFLWYAGCREQLPKIFKTVFKGEATTEPDLLAFTKCIHAGAGSKNGSRNEIRVTPLKEYLFEMELEAVKAEELEAKYKNHGK
jgi:hypothetical protein